MLKRTLYFSRPVYLRLQNRQFLYRFKDAEEAGSCPLEDLGFVLLDHPRISFSLPLLAALTENNTALIFCDQQHMPSAMLQPFQGHSLYNEALRAQLASPLPLRKRLWKQTVQAKIANQRRLLEQLGLASASRLRRCEESVKSGDPENKEAQAARLYWKALLGPNFKRAREGKPPNALLNYGYSLLRAATARALTGSGLLPALGIFHHNRANAFCLADDIMEPYRPFVDEQVYRLHHQPSDMNQEEQTGINKEQKKNLLQILSCDSFFPDKKRPLMIALTMSCASLRQCFRGEEKRLNYPRLGPKV